MKQIHWGFVFLGLIFAGQVQAAVPLGFGLSNKYCLGDVCLGEAAANHPELKISEELKKVAKYRKAPVCRFNEASVYLREVKYKNGTEGSIYLLADPANLSPNLEKYFRISTITVKFSPFLSPEAAKALEQKIAGRYKMARASAYSYEVKDGSRTIRLTVSTWESSLVMTGVDGSEYSAQPGCAQEQIPNL